MIKNQFQNLPLELRRLIAIRLKAKDLQNLRLTCQAFREFIFIHTWVPDENTYDGHRLVTFEYTLRKVQLIYLQLKSVYGENWQSCVGSVWTVDPGGAQGITLQKSLQGHVNPYPSVNPSESQFTVIDPIFRIYQIIGFGTINLNFIQGIDPNHVSALVLNVRNMSVRFCYEIVLKFRNLDYLAVVVNSQVLDTLGFLSNLPKLRTLKLLSDQSPWDEFCDINVSPPRLSVTHLEIHEGYYDFETVLQSMPSLTFLRFEGAGLRDVALAKTISLLPELQKFSFKECNVSRDFFDSVLSTLALNSKFKSLSLDLCEDDSGLEAIKKISNLEECEILFNELSAVLDTDIIASLSHCTKLRVMRLSGEVEDPHDRVETLIEELKSAVPKWPNLEVLFLEGIYLDANEVQALLETLKPRANLKYLRISAAALQSYTCFWDLSALDTLTIQLPPFVVVDFINEVICGPVEFKLRLLVRFHDDLEIAIRRKNDIDRTIDLLADIGVDIKADYFGFDELKSAQTRVYRN